jgi:hypothetical protein
VHINPAVTAAFVALIHMCEASSCQQTDDRRPFVLGFTGRGAKDDAASQLLRNRFVACAATAVVAVIGLIPLVLALRGIRAVGLTFALGVAAGLGTAGVRALSSVRGPRRLFTQTGRYLTAWTWTGPCTLDPRELRSVQARPTPDGVILALANHCVPGA